jgi:acetyl esterase/lipase
MKRLLGFVSGFLALISALVGLLLFYRIRSQSGRALFVSKVTASAVTPFAALMGAVGAGLGLLLRKPLPLLAGLFGAWASKRYIRQVTAPHDQFTAAFGPVWQGQVPVHLWQGFLWSRWQWTLQPRREPDLEQDVTFWVLPETGQQLLCDVWYPPTAAPRSGVGIIYLHGSGWQLLDKGVGTCAFFRHLAEQGHVVVDAAYRLAPETDFYGMVGDVKRAVAWMKVNAERLGLDPQRIVLAGGSAGGHLAMLAAYTPGHAELTPEDVRNVDTTVRGVVSFYGPSDMKAHFEHTAPLFRDPRRTSGQKDTTKTIFYRLLMALIRLNSRFAMPDMYRWSLKHGPARLEDDDRFVRLMGGTPDEAPENYSLFSPMTYAGPQSPPTLLFHGEHDYLVSYKSSLAMRDKLRQHGVPALAVVYPQTEHGFDLVLPAISPAVQSALYDLDRFLGIMAGGEEETGQRHTIALSELK